MKKIPLTHGKFALVDDEDFDKLNRHKWHVTYSQSIAYARRSVRGGKRQTTVRMHRVILNVASGLQVDHRDGDGLNNQKHNIRVCTRFNNAKNKSLTKISFSRYKGVWWNKRSRKWQVKIVSNGERYHLGYFTCLIKAAKAYDKAAKEYHGEFAKLNFPEAEKC